MMDSGFSAQLRSAFNLLMSPEGALALFALLLLLLGVVISPKGKWVVIVLMLWVTTLTFYVREGALVHLSAPLEQIRASARPLCTGLLACLILPTFMASRGWRVRLIGLPTIAFFTFEMLLTVRILGAGISDRGAVSAVIYPMLFLSLGWGLSKWLQDWTKAHQALHCIVWAALLFGAGSAYQLMMNPAAILRGNRFQGTTGNPQQAALILGIAIPATLYFVGRKDENKTLRILYGAAAGFLCVMLLWTGSRTGLLMVVVGVALMYRTHLGRFLVVGIFVGAFLLLAMQIYDESTLTIQGMFTRGDNRSATWRMMLETFAANPAFGTINGEFSVSENSYLSAAANSGLFGVIPLAVFLIATCWSVLRLQWLRKYLPDGGLLVDYLTGAFASLFIGAVFEGFLLGTLTFQVFAIYIFLAVVAFVRDMAHVSAITANLPLPADSQAYEEDSFYPAAGTVTDGY